MPDDRPHRIRNRGVIVVDPTGLIDRAAHGNGDLETVPVDVAAFMPGGELGQRLGGLEIEILGERDDHV